ncbi:hypothetical protein QKU48_gp0874 [Fadolivirus algeromassiliense]|jgi:hypothetical protein|uniref:Uncharacterized protein n=1 Tax=Fadolivirus FV1/VV64 TaxID=3070911 RepID=A0A7D3V5U9_9VIRU|nr:hypothetical protein QKU48_gp0874 [Fadolivirus algeromassiliense]QKF94332.1 hypothetical protein Fadolivirus_1_874 [Fadolivirus FV1/VV64]
MYTIFFISVLLLILFISLNGYSEFFDDIKPRVHAKLNRDCGVEYYSWQSPSQNGEQGCGLVPCPKGLGDNITCWTCCNYF